MHRDRLRRDEKNQCWNSTRSVFHAGTEEKQGEECRGLAQPPEETPFVIYQAEAAHATYPALERPFRL